MYQFVIVLFMSTVSAQLVINGPCNFTNVEHHPGIPLMIAGQWHQIERIPNSIEKGDCSRTTLIIGINNTSMSGNKYDSEVVNGKLVLRNASITATAELGVWNVIYNDGVSRNVVVLGTDYTEYLMLYSCQNNEDSSSTISAWKLGRNRTYSANASNAIHTLAVKANIANTTWKVVDHSEAACEVKSGAVNLQISPILFLLLTLGLAKEF